MELPGGLVFLASTFISVVRQVALRLPGASRVEWLVASVDISAVQRLVTWAAHP